MPPDLPDLFLLAFWVGAAALRLTRRRWAPRGLSARSPARPGPARSEPQAPAALVT